MNDKPVFDLYLSNDGYEYFIIIHRKTAKSFTIGRGKHSDIKQALTLALSNLEHNMKFR